MTDTQPQAPDTTTPDRGVVVPDRPALEGLEATWSERWSCFTPWTRVTTPGS